MKDLAAWQIRSQVADSLGVKDHVSKVSTPMSDRGGSYGVGMFGVGAR